MTFVVFAAPVSQAADYWGRRWLLIILAFLGCVGTIITSRATTVSAHPISSRNLFADPNQQIGMAIAGEVFVGACFASTVR